MSVEAGRTPGQTHRTSYDAETHARLTADSDAIVARYGDVLDRVSFDTPYASDPAIWVRLIADLKAAG